MRAKKLHAAGAAILIAAMTLLSGAAQASVQNATHVTNLFVGQDGNVFFDVADPKPQKPACAPNDNYVFALNSAAGQAWLAVLITSKATGKAVDLGGSDGCTINNATETLTFVTLKP